jgi:hypothetical protein
VRKFFFLLSFFPAFVFGQTCIDTLERDYPRLIPPNTRVVLINGGPVLLQTRGEATYVWSKSGSAAYNGNSCRPDTRSDTKKEVARWINQHDGISEQTKKNIAATEKELENAKADVKVAKEKLRRSGDFTSPEVELQLGKERDLVKTLSAQRANARSEAKEYMAWLTKCWNQSENDSVKEAARSRLQQFYDRPTTGKPTGSL